MSWNSFVLFKFFDRFGIGRFTTLEEIDYTVEKVVQNVQRLREMRYVLTDGLNELKENWTLKSRLSYLKEHLK